MNALLFCARCGEETSAMEAVLRSFHTGFSACCNENLLERPPPHPVEPKVYTGAAPGQPIVEYDRWQLDEYDAYNMYVGPIHVSIQKRPPYCDRGHWIARVDGIPSLDGADGFPRYFMNLERAKAEMTEWVAWRMLSDKSIT